jgi:hypothetical protein
MRERDRRFERRSLQREDEIMEKVTRVPSVGFGLSGDSPSATKVDVASKTLTPFDGTEAKRLQGASDQSVVIALVETKVAASEGEQDVGDEPAPSKTPAAPDVDRLSCGCQLSRGARIGLQVGSIAAAAVGVSGAVIGGYGYQSVAAGVAMGAVAAGGLAAYYLLEKLTYAFK